MKERPGLVGEADGSTLFLDEIGEFPEALQTHLLRLLDEGGEYHRLGESRERTTDIRLIGATNRGTEHLKHDFLARFVVRISLPSLNDRREDIPLLARQLLLKAGRRDPELTDLYFDAHGDRSFPRVAPDLMEALCTHRYQSHVRELETLLWAAITSSTNRWIRLTPQVRELLSNTEDDKEVPAIEITAEVLRDSMTRHGGVQARVWREFGLKNRYVLRRLLKKHGIESTEDTED